MNLSSLANLFLVAAPRSGSTQLASWLASHPDVFVTRVKEPNYFSQHEFSQDFVRNERLDDVDPSEYVHAKSKEQYNFAVFRTREQYDYLFEGVSQRWRMDASTTYLSCPESPRLIADYNSESRCIVLLRDPVSRAVSHYRLRVRLGRTASSLARELDEELDGHLPLAARYLIRPSLYTSSVNRLLENFSPDRVKFVSFERMIRSQEQTLAEICHWLDVDPCVVSRDSVDKNSSAAPRFPTLVRLLHRTGVKQMLRRHFSYDTWQRLKKVVFSQSRQVPVSEAEVDCLRKALQDDGQMFSSAFPEIARHWSV